MPTPCFPISIPPLQHPTETSYDKISTPAVIEFQQDLSSMPAWQPDIKNIAQQPSSVTTSLPTCADSLQRTSTKRSAGGELVRPKSRRLPHNLIERRYRDNLNHQIDILRDELPTFKAVVTCNAADVEDTTVSPLAGKWPSKAVVIAAAIQYIGLLEQQRGQAMSRNTLLCGQVAGLQRLVRCDDCAIVKYMEGLQPQMLAGQ
ncbi:hypothetical protein LTR56_026935 [Elasticomyces elasticus]|nr:hypothetical protein LTR56_026935 [Elasticomyces elasticus]